MRTVKEHDARKNEIIDTAAALFTDKGYDQCSINDILNSIGIAKGTFYHYFKSKEDVLDAAVNKISEKILYQAQEIAAKKEIPPSDRIIQVLLTTRVTGHTEKGLIQEIHKMQNALLHQKILVSIITMLTPVFAEIVKEGNGAMPPKGKKVRVHYVGTFTNGKLFDKSDDVFEFVVIEF